MNYKQADYAEYKLYVGSVKGDKGPVMSEAQLVRVVQDYQQTWFEEHGVKMPVRFTKTTFVCLGCVESGWELVVINYPRNPRPGNELEEFVTGLQMHLIVECGQNRVTVMYDGYEGNIAKKIIMAERDEFEPCHNT
jgi:hypothetical protein